MAFGRARRSIQYASADRKAKPASRYAEQPAVAAILKMLSRPRGATVAEIAKARGLQPHTVRSILSRLGSKAGIQLTRTKVGSSGDRLSGACQADLKPTKSIGAKCRCSINGCNNKREEGIAELIQIIWQIRMPAVAALPRRKGAGRPAPALSQAPGCPMDQEKREGQFPAQLYCKSATMHL